MNKEMILGLAQTIESDNNDNDLWSFTGRYKEFTRAMNTNSDKYRYQYLIANLASEAGEVAGLYAKHLRDGGDPDYYNILMKKELGDIMWHISELCNEHDWDIEDIILYNVYKLVARLEKNTVRGSGDDR